MHAIKTNAVPSRSTQSDQPGSDCKPKFDLCAIALTWPELDAPPHSGSQKMLQSDAELLRARSASFCLVKGALACPIAVCGPQQAMFLFRVDAGKD